jgi:hypothetical protein
MIVTPYDGNPISAPGIFSGVPSKIYHGPDLCVGPSISSSGLRTIFTDSAMEYWIRSPYNPNRLEQEDSRAFVLGRAAHHLCLGEADFKKFFIVRPAEYPDQKTGELKKWTRAANYCKAREKEWTDASLDILTPEELEAIKGLAGIQPWQKGLDDSGLMNNAVVRAGALQGLVEHTIIAQDKETGVFLKSRPDVIPTASREATDFKTTQSIAGYKLQQTLDDLRYDMQGELVSRCLEQAADFRLTNFALIFAAKKEPHEVAVRELKPYDLDESAKDNQAAIRTFALCMERGKWPGVGGGEDDARYLERSDRSRERAAARREQLERGMFT